MGAVQVFKPLHCRNGKENPDRDAGQHKKTNLGEEEAKRAHLACLDSSISRAVIGPKSRLSRTQHPDQLVMSAMGEGRAVCSVFARPVESHWGRQDLLWS